MLSDATDRRKVALPWRARLHHGCLPVARTQESHARPFGAKDSWRHGPRFFTEVIDDKDGVRATLGDFDDPGRDMVWSANPVVTFSLSSRPEEQP